jgi:hypothetical protein
MERVFEKQVKQKNLHTLYELGLYDSEAPIILHGIVCRGDFSQVLIMVTNTGTEDFALADIGRLTFTVELFHSNSLALPAKISSEETPRLAGRTCRLEI